MSKASPVTSARLSALCVLSALLVAILAGAAAADEYKFPSGVSFTYPSGCQASETKQPPSVTVTLVNPSDPMVMFVVSLRDDADGAFPDDEPSEEELKATMPEGTKLLAYKKIKIGGNDARLFESSMEENGASVFTRGVTIVSGKNAINVVAVIMDKSKVDDGYKIADDIMNSIKF